MKRFCIFASVVVLAAISCQREVVEVVECGEPTAAVESSPYAISKEEALGRLEDFMAAFDGEDTRSRSRVVKSISAVRGEDIMAETRGSECEVENLLYIAEFEDGCGSAILGADSRLEPVYAVLDETVMTIDDFRAAENGEEADDVTVFAARMISDKARITIQDSLILINPGEGDGGGFRSDWQNDETHVTVTRYIAPLLNTKWEQKGDFNDKISDISTRTNEHDTDQPAGCATIALAQVLNCNCYPNPLSINGNCYDWADINCFTFDRTITDKRLRDTLASFIYDVAETLGARYNSDGSTSANIDDATQAMRSLGYIKVMQVPLTTSRVYPHINGSRPVMVFCETSGDGHAWVIDGWKTVNTKCVRVTYNGDNEPIDEEVLSDAYTEYAHCNMGWKGKCDGYYTLNLFDTTDMKEGDEYEPEYGDVACSLSYIYSYGFEVLVYNF